jgi:recombination protein RecR
MTPDAIKKLATLLAELPSLGPRQASRLAFHIAGLPTQSVAALTETLQAVARIKRCTRCFVLDDLTAGICTICANKRRDQSTIAIVEKETDVQTLEKTKVYQGRYLVLGVLPKDGVLEPHHRARLQALKDHIAELPEKRAEELLIAFSPTTHGDTLAGVIAGQLHTYTKKITRLGRGIPTGGEIEFADEDTLGAAIKNRS